MSRKNDQPVISPWDAPNQELAAQVHPSDWKNPQPASCYNLVVIGAGTAGLVTAAGAAGLGAKVALIEKHLLGGDCLNVGCVPSKSIIRSSRVVADIRDGQCYGVNVPDGVSVEFGAVMERMRGIRARISHHDSVQRLSESGVDVFLGHGQFADSDTVSVAGSTLRFKKAVIATGARAVTPRIEGIERTGFLTNETVFNLTERPARMAVVGGGPIGCELAQAFQRLGTQVTLFHKNEHLLDREDADAADIIQERFKREGIRLILGCAPTRAQTRGPEKAVYYSCEGKEYSVVVDEILAGAGRAANVEGLNLESVGVQYDKRRGIQVDDRLETTNSRIYAAGDVCMKWKFTHAADAAARIVIRNALFLGRKKLSSLTMPWCTYTDPEIAHVGLYERQAKDRGIEVDTYKLDWSEVDRAITDGEQEGFVKIHVRRGTDRIVGATIVAAHAGEMISEVSVAMAGKVGLGKLSEVIHPYPTQAEAIKKAADDFSRTRLTPTVKKLFSGWLAWNRRCGGKRK